ncbi:MAG: hypothetical protein LBC96_03550 [Lachnospiraceae bacterium]|jgi:hypothetical protein|nr:hypothetical protein [Lachnospiraceae bacterium]
MSNFISFANTFLSYFLLYIISATLVVTGLLLGIRYRKFKDKKAALAEAETTATSDDTSE